MQDLKIIRVTEKDISVVSDLASTIWNQHYPSIIGQEQVDYMLELMYSQKSLIEQLHQQGHLFFVITLKDENIGFISVHEEKSGEWHLNKFYIDQDVAAKGIGTASFQLLVEQIKPQTLTLQVNRKNHKSINFYFKNGFRIEEVKDFDIGKGYVMEDFIMTWKKRSN